MVWDDKTLIIWLVVCSLLHKTPLVQPQPQATLAQPSAVVFTFHHPSRSQSPTFHRREDSFSGPPSTSAYSRDVTCPVTSPRVPPYVSHVSPATRSVTSPSAFHEVSLIISRQPGSQLCKVLRLGCALQGFCLLSRSPVSSDRVAVWVVSCLMRVPEEALNTHGQYQSKEWCVYAVTVHVYVL